MSKIENDMTRESTCHEGLTEDLNEIEVVENRVSVVENDEETSPSTETYDSQEEISNPPKSELTVENLQRYEKENNPMKMEEIVFKQKSENTSYEEEISYQDKQSSVSPMPTLPVPELSEIPRISIQPSQRLITRGLKLTGEEYEAVSIDIQTDESWLLNQDPFVKETTATQHIKSPRSEQSADVSNNLNRLRTPDVEILEAAKRFTSDISASDFVDSEEEIRLSKRSPKLSTSSENESGEFNPVTEVEIDDLGAFASDEHSSDDFTTVNTVSPPFILQYKRESQEMELNYDSLKPPELPSITSISDMDEDDQDYYQGLLNESKKRRRKRAKDKSHKLINISPHDAFSSKQVRMELKKEEKERTAAKNKAKEIERRKQLETQAANQANFFAFARQLKTINYALSSEKCMDEGWTIKPKTPEPPLEPSKEFFVQETGTNILSGKKYKRAFVQKQYDNGNIFLGIFPDGSGTVWYPSGNVAISIVSTEKQGKLIYIVHEDKEYEENPKIQAVFEPDGNCTCYYPDGGIRANLNSFGGEYYSARGERTKRWQWRDKETHVHAPPFQPITFGLSKQVGVRIIAQDSIFVTFTDGKRSVRFNVGTKLRIKSGVPTKEELIDLNSLLLQDRVAYVQTLLQRFYSTFQFPHSPRRAQIQLPNYLNNKLEKISRLRSSVEKLPPIKEQIKSTGPASQKPNNLLLPPISSVPKRKITKLINRNEVKKPECQFVVTVN